MEQNPSETNSYSGYQEISHLLCNPLLNPYPEPDDPVHTLSPHFSRPILILSSCLCLGLPSDLFLSGFLVNILCAMIIYYVCKYVPVLNILKIRG